jgi:hypothetical protein
MLHIIRMNGIIVSLNFRDTMEGQVRKKEASRASSLPQLPLRPNFELFGSVHDENQMRSVIRINTDQATSLTYEDNFSAANGKHCDRLATAKTPDPAQFRGRRRDTISWPAGREQPAYQPFVRTAQLQNRQHENVFLSEARHEKPVSAENRAVVSTAPDNRQLACCQINLADLDAALKHFDAKFGVKITSNGKKGNRTQSLREIANSSHTKAGKIQELDFLHLEASKGY